MKRDFEPVAKFCREQLLPICRKIKHAIEERGRQAGEFFRRKHRQAHSFLDKKQARLKNLSAHYVVDALLSQSWLPNWLKACIQKWFSHPFVKGFCEGVVSIYSLAARTCLQFFSFLLQISSKGAKVVRDTVGRLRFYWSALSLKLSMVLSTTYRACRKAAFYSLYCGLLYTLMAGIVLVWGLSSLGNLLNSLTKRLGGLLQHPSFKN